MQTKNFIEFGKDISRHDNLQPKCKQCCKLYRDKMKIKGNKYSREYYKRNKDALILYGKEYTKKNKEKVNKRNDAYRKRNYKININYTLCIVLRRRFSMALKNNYKSGSAVTDLGCTIEQLKVYLESKFTEGMNWNNQGEWHIDHIKPLASFNLIDPLQIKIACHYTNLQPLWAIDNYKKGAR